MRIVDIPELAAKAGAEHRSAVPLAGLTTLRAGGPARDLVTCRTADALVEATGRLDAAGEPVLMLAGGSNLLIGDAGFDGAAVRIAHDEMSVAGPVVEVGAGAVWDDVVAASVRAGLGGLECLSGIPGSAGATPVQNVGAYGVEVAEVLDQVELFDRRTRQRHWVGPEDLHLGYRTSALKRRDDAVVLTVRMRLHPDGLSAPIRYAELARTLGVEPGERVPAAEARRAVLELRAGKGMLSELTLPDGAVDHDCWSAGSFFTNPILDEADLPGVLDTVAAEVGADARVPRFPAGEGRVKLSAGWLIERAGFGKGHPGPDASARLSTKHTLALTNRGAASASDLVRLAREVRGGVLDVFGVQLEPEPVLVGCVL